ncbi:E3 ubiquitin-protein ligase WAV3-like [Wolffia australiana]
MGTGWRKALCTAVWRDTDDDSTPHETPSSRKSGFFRASRSCPSTPRLRQETPSAPSPPVLRCRTGPPAAITAATVGEKASQKDQVSVITTTVEASTPRSKPRGVKLFPFISANPPSPRSPYRIAQLLKNNFRSTRGKCGICLQSVKAVKGTAIFTAECSHTFHLQCLAINSQQRGSCPVCAAAWLHAPLLCSLNAEGGHRKQQQRPNYPLKVEIGSSSSARAEVYDDDEPLSSRHRACFYPIPEAEDDAVGGLRVAGCPDAALLAIGRSHEYHVVALKVKSVAPKTLNAPLLDPSRRAPIDLVTVLDVASGALTGAKLQALRRAMRLVWSCLGPRDRLAMVTASGARRLLPLRRMTVDGQRAARRIVDKLFYDVGESFVAATETALGMAFKVLVDRKERNPVAAVVLLRLGPPREDERREWCSPSREFILVEVPLDSEAVEGNALAQCVGGRLSVVCRDVRVEVNFPGGAVKSVYCRRNPPACLGSGGRFGLGDLHASQETEILLEVKIDGSAAGQRAGRLLVRCSYRDPVTEKLIQWSECSLPVFLAPNRDSLPKAEFLRDIFVAARAVAEARSLAEVGDFATGLHLLVSARRLLLQSDSVCADDAVRSVELAQEELRWRRRRAEGRRVERLASNSAVSGSARAEALTPMSAWRAAERLARVAMSRKSQNRVSDLHGFENARF